MSIREQLAERVVDFAKTWTIAEGWEWFHDQTFERVGLELMTKKARFRECKACFESGREVERENWSPKPAPKQRGHLSTV